MPSVPIETPSDTEIVLNSIGVPPPARMPSLTNSASRRWLKLQGIVSIQVVATPTSGRARSSSVNPMALSIARAGARSGPSVRACECRLAPSVGRSYGSGRSGIGQSLGTSGIGLGARYPRAVDDRVAVLRGVHLFSDLDDHSLQAVALLARDVTATAGEVLLLEGEPGDEFYVIIEGSVRIEHGDRTVRSMTTGALADRRARTATATCVTDCRLLAIRGHEFERLMDTMPAVRGRIQAAIERRARTDASPTPG